MPTTKPDSALWKRMFRTYGTLFFLWLATMLVLFVVLPPKWEWLLAIDSFAWPVAMMTHMLVSVMRYRCSPCKGRRNALA